MRRCRESQGSNTAERFITSRHYTGNQRQNLFHDDKDREFYLGRLEQYRKRYRFTIYAYVLMSNHVHLLIETGKTPLSKIMQGLQFSYTRYFNRRYRKIGHLF